MSDVRWGIMGAARIAHQFVQDLAHVRESSARAIFSRTHAHAKAFASRYEIDAVFHSYDDMLANPEIDAIYIATPHTLHLPNALDALSAGKAVLCEKPLVTSVSDAQMLINAARETDTYLMEAMWTWFLPAIHTAKRWVDDGRIGKLIQIKADFGYPMRPYSPDLREYDASLGGGALLDMGIYPVALLWYFLQQQPAKLTVSSRHAPNGVDDDVLALLEYDDCVASIGTSFRCKLPNWAYLIGEDGYIGIPDFWRARSCFLYEGDACVDRFDDERTSIGLNFETQAVVNDLAKSKTESDVVTFADSLAFQETMERIRHQFTHTE